MNEDRLFENEEKFTFFVSDGVEISVFWELLKFSFPVTFCCRLVTIKGQSTVVSKILIQLLTRLTEALLFVLWPRWVTNWVVMLVLPALLVIRLPPSFSCKWSKLLSIWCFLFSLSRGCCFEISLSSHKCGILWTTCNRHGALSTLAVCDWVACLSEDLVNLVTEVHRSLDIWSQLKSFLVLLFRLFRRLLISSFSIALVLLKADQIFEASLRIITP